MTTILATVIVLGVIIFVHELGHLWAAKLVDIEVERFSIGFGPVIWGFQWGETEYVISALPLGGFVKMGGMEDEVMEYIEGGDSDDGAVGEERVPGPRDYDAKPVWARSLVISAGVIMNMVFAYLAFALATAATGEPVQDTVRVGNVRAEILPEGTEAMAQIPEGAYIGQIGDRSVEHWGDVVDALRSVPAGPTPITVTEPSRTVTVDLPADPGARDQLAGAVQYWQEPFVGQVSPGSPAEDGGLEAGDRIVAVGGVPVETWSDLVEQVRANTDQETEFTVERDGSELVRVVTPEMGTITDPVTGESIQSGSIGVISAGVPISYRPVSLVDAAVIGLQETWGATYLILDFLRDLFTGDVSPREVGSVFTIGEASGQFLAQGIVPFVRFMALFSINLAILNILPIPVLDGGHLVFLGIEAVRGKAVSIEQRLRWSQVGLFLLVGLMIWALSNDVLRLLGM